MGNVDNGLINHGADPPLLMSRCFSLVSNASGYKSATEATIWPGQAISRRQRRRWRKEGLAYACRKTKNKAEEDEEEEKQLLRKNTFIAALIIPSAKQRHT